MIKYTYSCPASGRIINASRWMARDRKETEKAEVRTYMWSKIKREGKGRKSTKGGSYQAIVILIRKRMEMLWIYFPNLFSGSKLRATTVFEVI